MTARRGLVLDANILIRAVLGQRVRGILLAYEDTADFYAPDACVAEARRYLPLVLGKRGLDAGLGLSLLAQVTLLVQPVERALYQHCELQARQRLGSRDPEDWPVVALALALDLPIWTEDQDLFGAGVPTWTTDRVELYLKAV
jgi:predicted nucleic acid-binding protein